ncbi:MAG: hypothetical protein OXC92_01585 [Flavobacteriaceae bacterium]|nr:hypothetical protein [Flavobacteriaceae bacterium]MCY4254024.1 hypothetical protein [Flavobacteriaceae bacterium]
MKYTRSEDLKAGQWIKVASEPKPVQVKSIRINHTYSIPLFLLEIENLQGQRFEFANLLSQGYYI